MSKYWIYIDDEVQGPFSVDQLIRLRGFSRQARVCAQDGQEGPQTWISPADIPELAHIFKAADETHALPTPKPKPKPATPQKPRPRAAPTASENVAPPSKKHAFPWEALLAGFLILGVIAAIYVVWRQALLKKAGQERRAAQEVVENTVVPGRPGAMTIRESLEARKIRPRWEFEKQPTELYHVTMSWFEPETAGLPITNVAAFEANLQAQTVRPINSRAADLLANGLFPAKKAEKGPAESAKVSKPKAPAFNEAVQAWREATQSGDFDTVWNVFSDRKVREMARGGISRSGFLKLQALTYKLESDKKLTEVQTREEGPEARWVLIKQTQPNRGDVFIKQYWVLENGAWKLDDEQKKAAVAATPTPTPESSAAPAKVPVTSLPGLSN